MLRVTLAQVNQTVGDFDTNVARLVAAVRTAESDGTQVIVAPELAVTGYPPEDLLLKTSFVDANLRALDEIARATGETIAVVGFVDRVGSTLFNAAAVCAEGKVAGVYHKHLLPNYGVFDERRYFEPGTDHLLIDTDQGILGGCVCEDAWSPEGPV
ncbi:MAG: NAD+ synthase, partial [Actinomycetota bacterium]|nr:NAD+ synthase [Actinomycetota bacterium]